MPIRHILIVDDEHLTRVSPADFLEEGRATRPSLPEMGNPREPGPEHAKAKPKSAAHFRGRYVTRDFLNTL